jgi:hypothetical protein
LSAHWRLAVWGAALAAAFSLLGSLSVYYYFDAAHAAGYLYGAAVGVVCFTSIAVTAWLLGGPMAGDRIALGTIVYFGRLMLAAAGLGVPLYLGTWPALATLGGFAGVYVVENVLVLIGAGKVGGVRGQRVPRA